MVLAEVFFSPLSVSVEISKLGNIHHLRQQETRKIFPWAKSHISSKKNPDTSKTTDQPLQGYILK